MWLVIHLGQSPWRPPSTVRQLPVVNEGRVIPLAGGTVQVQKQLTRHVRRQAREGAGQAQVEVGKPGRAHQVRACAVVCVLQHSLSVDQSSGADFGKGCCLLLAKMVYTFVAVFFLEIRPHPERKCTGRVAQPVGDTRISSGWSAVVRGILGMLEWTVLCSFDAQVGLSRNRCRI